MLMAVRGKLLSEAEKLDLFDALAPIAARRAGVSRRTQALLAGAGQDGPAKRWYVLMIQPGFDISVDNALGTARVERWMAAVKIEGKRRGGRKFQTFCPLVAAALPGYLFVRVAWESEAWHGLTSIEGVAGIIGGAMRPAPLQDKEIDRLRKRVEKDPTFIATLVNALKAGDDVRVDDGPFTGFEGVVNTLLGKGGRVKVDVDIFGRIATVDLDVAQISKSE